MVNSLAFIVSTNSECLTCGDFSLSKTIHFGSHEFIADFGGLSLSPRRNDLGTVFISSTNSGPPSPL
jgi:hypothetical protein